MNLLELVYPRFYFDKSKPVKLFEAFAGIGTQHMALKRLGCKVEMVGISEIDNNAIKSYEAIHGQVKNYGGVGSFDRFPKDIDILTWSFPCFTADTLVLTDKGYVEIVKLEKGAKVLTHTNKWQEVMNQFNQGEKEVFEIKSMAFEELKATANHRFYTREMSRKGHKPIRTFAQPKWVEVKELTKKHYLGYAINKVEQTPDYVGYKKTYCDGRVFTFNRLVKYMNNKDFWWLVGRYIGDGWQRQNSGIIICDDKRTYKDITIVLDRLGLHYSLDLESTAAKIHIVYVEILNYLKQFGSGAANKQLTSDIFNLPIDLLKSFLDGYISADGSINKNGLIRVSSISKKLIYGIGQCVAKVYKRPFSIYKTPARVRKHQLNGRTINGKEYFSLHFKTTTNKQDKAFYEDGYVWFPIKSIKSIGKELVYDISVKQDESFTANGAIVHNCQDISLAGKQRGLVDGSRSNYGYVFLDTVKNTPYEERPKVLIMENVPALVSETFQKDYQEIHERLENMGYQSYAALLNAKDYGVAQNRNRIFVVSILGDYSYTFPERIKLEKRLLDYSEEEVDEKYYLSQKMIDGMKTTSFSQYKLENKLQDGNGIADTILARFEGAPSVIAIPEANKQGYSLAENGDGVYLDRPHQKRGCVQKGMIQTIKANGSDVGVVVKTWNDESKVYKTKEDDMPRNRIYENESVGFTITTNLSQQPAIIEPTLRIRKLTPRECWRLMGISDDDFDKASKVNSNSQLYKQAGNAIVVDVLEAIFREMIK